MEKIWIFANEQEYKQQEGETPEKILEYYGEKLNEDSNELLEYAIHTDFIQDSNAVKRTLFYAVVPRQYEIRLFEIIYSFDNIYPCKFHSYLTENRYDCTTKEILKQRIEEEIANKRLMAKLTSLLHHFYDKEEIEKLIK